MNSKNRPKMSHEFEAELIHRICHKLELYCSVLQIMTKYQHFMI